MLIYPKQIIVLKVLEISEKVNINEDWYNVT